MIRRIAYLCLQTTQEGQAAYAHVNEIINGLRRRGITVDLYAPRVPAGSRSRGQLARAWSFLAVQLRLLLRLPGYDCLYVRAHFAAVPASCAARLFRVPQVHEVNGPLEDLHLMYPWTRRLPALFTGLCRFQWRAAAAVIAVTPQLAAQCMQDLGHANVHVVPNGANTDLFRPGVRHPDAPGSPYAIFFGAFSPWQGIENMLQAVSSPRWPAGTRLVMVGDGMERPKVESAAALGNGVLYLGAKAYREMAGYIAPAAVGLCVQGNPEGRSRTGLAPLKLYEMMASGIPVVVTDFPGQADLVRRADAGKVIPDGDPEALAKAVADLALAPEEARTMGQRGREVVAREHSWDCRSQATLEILAACRDRGVRP
jgi:glycosyltransferase involved in cell wall biosynthesis